MRNSLFQTMTLLIAIALGSVTASAQESPGEEAETETEFEASKEGSLAEKSLIRFAALTQFVEGDVNKLDAQKVRTPVDFRTPIYEGERIQVARGGMLKLVTQSGCIAVFYGESTVLSPNREKPWRFKSEAVRWICPEGAKESVVSRGLPLEINSGEFFQDGRRLLVLRGQVSTKESELPTSRMLQFQNRGFKIVQPEPSSFDLWSFNEKRRPPQESTAVPKPETPKPKKIEAPKNVRIIVGPTGGGGRLIYDNDSLSEDHLDSEGGRLQTHIRWGQGSFILLYRHQSLNADYNKGGAGITPSEGVHNDSELDALEFGYRFNHDRWWSPYFRLGVGAEKPKIFVSLPGATSAYFSGTEYEFWMLTAAAGIDAQYSPQWLNWFGVYASADLNLQQSLGRGARKVFHEFNSSQGDVPEAGEPWRLTSVSLQLMLGLFVQF